MDEVEVVVALEAVQIQGRERSPSFRTLSVHEARALLLYGIERRLPLQLVTAKAGGGKSRLLSALSRTCGGAADLLLVPDLPDSLEAIVQRVLVGLGERLVPDQSTLERLGRLADTLAERRSKGRLVALLLDDAHRIAPSTLLDLRLFTGTDPAGGALLPIVAAGRPELADTLSSPGMEPLYECLATQIALQRPLPAEAPPEPEPEATPAPRQRRALPIAVPLVAALAVALGAIVGTLLRQRPPLSAPRPAPAVAAVPLSQSPLDEPNVTVAPDPPEPLPPLPAAHDGAITASDVRSLITTFARALEAGDADAIATLFAPRARQNGVRGRDAIARTYAYRFARVDAPTVIEAPTELTLRGDVGHATTRFTTGYRDASGAPGELHGVLSWRIVRQGDQPLIADLDYAYEVAAP